MTLLLLFALFLQAEVAVGVITAGLLTGAGARTLPLEKEHTEKGNTMQYSLFMFAKPRSYLACSLCIVFYADTFSNYHKRCAA